MARTDSTAHLVIKARNARQFRKFCSRSHPHRPNSPTIFYASSQAPFLFAETLDMPGHILPANGPVVSSRHQSGSLQRQPSGILRNHRRNTSVPAYDGSQTGIPDDRSTVLSSTQQLRFAEEVTLHPISPLDVTPTAELDRALRAAAGHKRSNSTGGEPSSLPAVNEASYEFCA